MAKLPSVSTITTGYASVQALNDNFEALKAAFTNTVSRDGSTPNSMSADLDLNSNDVKNVKTIDADKFILDGTLMTPSGVDPVYSGTISTLGANLIDDTTGDAMLDTMGITASVAQLNYSNGVTSSIQSQLDTLTTSVNGKQSESDILTDLSGLTQAASKIPYFDTSTTASTLDFKDEDNMVSDSATAVPSQQSVKAYVDLKSTPQVFRSDWTTGWTLGGEYVFTHNFNTLPNGYHLEFECITDADTYTAGDMIVMSLGERYSGWGADVVGVSTTQVTIGIHASGVVHRRKTTGTSEALTSASWKWRLVASV